MIGRWAHDAGWKPHTGCSGLAPGAPPSRARRAALGGKRRPGSAHRTSARALATAPVKALLRPLLRWYVAPLVDAQREFNDVTLKLIDELHEAVSASLDERLLVELEERVLRLERGARMGAPASSPVRPAPEAPPSRRSTTSASRRACAAPAPTCSSASGRTSRTSTMPRPSWTSVAGAGSSSPAPGSGSRGHWRRPRPRHGRALPSRGPGGGAG